MPLADQIPPSGDNCFPPAAKPAASAYAFDASWPRERERLKLLTSIFDPLLVAHLSHTALSTSGRALDLGAGTGSVARLLIDRFDMSVDAIDIDCSQLEAHDETRLRALQRDATNLVGLGSYDLVHARFLLVHLGQRGIDVLGAWCSALRPGGLFTLVESSYGSWTPSGPPAMRAARICYLAHIHALGWDPKLGTRLTELLSQHDAEVVRHDIHDGRFVCGDAVSRLLALSLLSQASALIRRGLSDADLQAAINWLLDGQGSGTFAQTHFVTACR